MTTLDKFTMSYIETLLWSSTDNANEQGGDPLDKNYSIEDIDPDALSKIVADCTTFQGRYWDDISADVERAGHDFWLTRNRHGAGFWDGDWPEDIGKRLTDASHAYGETDAYVGDDNKIYLFP